MPVIAAVHTQHKHLHQQKDDQEVEDDIENELAKDPNEV